MHSFVTASEKDEVNPGDPLDQEQSTQKSLVGKVDALFGTVKMSLPFLSQRPTTHETAGHSVSTSRAGKKIIMNIFPGQCDEL